MWPPPTELTDLNLFPKRAKSEKNSTKKVLWLNIVLIVTDYCFKTKDETTINSGSRYVNTSLPFCIHITLFVQAP